LVVLLAEWVNEHLPWFRDIALSAFRTLLANLFPYTRSHLRRDTAL
jgi:hypothetical protein